MPIRPKRDPDTRRPNVNPLDILPPEGKKKAVSFQLPPGDVKTKPPYVGVPRFGVPWANAAPALSILEAASEEFDIDIELLIAVGLIESGWRQFLANGAIVEGGDAYGGCTAKGFMQVKDCYHAPAGQKLQPPADWRILEGNIRLGAHLFATWSRGLGSWERAIREKYHPGTSPNGTTPQHYVDCIKGLVSEMRQASPVPNPGPTPVPVPDDPAKPDPWRPYPKPKMVELIVQKPAWDGAGFNRCAPRGDRIVGFATHITDGPPSQTIEFFASFFGTGGARAWDALTDYVIGWDGRIGVLNDPFDINKGGTRAGWANGGVDGLEGDGVLFYRHYPMINEVLASCEHCQKAGGPWSDAMIESSIELRTWLAQKNRIPAAEYPYPTKFKKVRVEQEHRNFATKSCPAAPYVDQLVKIIVPEVQKRLAKWQGGAVGPIPDPAPEPTPAELFTKWGLDRQHLEYRFGTLTRVGPDGSAAELPFDPKGPVSLAWLARCEEEGKFPEAEELRQFDTGLYPGPEWWASFEGGWTLVKPVADSRAAWQWLDRIEAAKAEARAIGAF